MSTERADRFCGSEGSGADIGVFGMMSSIILTAQLIINIINSSNNNNNNNNDRNNNNNNNNDRNNNNNNNNLNDNSMVMVNTMNMNMNQAGGRQFKTADVDHNDACVSETTKTKLALCIQRLG